VRWIVGGAIALTAIALAVFWKPPPPRSTSDRSDVSPNAPSASDFQLEWEALQTRLDQSASTIESLEEISRQELSDLETTSTPPADTAGKDEP
jgi:hypothetical protein